MKNRYKSILVILLIINCSCSHHQSNKVIQIGNQVWMKQNLSVTRFRNNDIIPEVKSNLEWVKAGKERKAVWCYYENNYKIGQKYGKLYNWFAVNDSRGLAPVGFHIPSDNEWDQLDIFLGSSNTGEKLKSIYYWDKKFIGSNEIGFSAIPTGFRSSDGYFNAINYEANWWSITSGDLIFAWSRKVGCADDYLTRDYSNKCNGFSVRCLMN